MTTIEIPADLVGLKREFIRVGNELADLSRAMPSGAAIIAGDAAEDPADRERWNAPHAKQGELVMQIHRHPSFDGLSQMERYELNEAASKAARGSA